MPWPDIGPARRRLDGVTACRRVSRLLSLAFWISVAGLVWTQAGYGLLLAGLRRRRRSPGPSAPALPPEPGDEPDVTLIVAAYREESVIAAKVANARGLDWPLDRLQVVVAGDGGADAATADATAVRAARGDILAFSDANALWRRDALPFLVAPFADPQVGYACGQVTFVNEEGTNQEGLYWRYEMWLREHESALASVTGGNGAIYAVRPAAYIEVDPIMGHDLSFPFNMVKRAVYAPGARAGEKMVPSIEGEWARKRRMMSHAWPIVIRGGMLDFRGYPPLYALMIGSHRVLRYASPLLHVVALVTSLALLRRAPVYRAAAGAQVALLAAAAAGGRRRWRPLLLARYYVLTTAALAGGLYDWLRHGTTAGWDAPEGTR